MERIICSAIWWPDYPIVKDIPSARPVNCPTGAVFSGHRHHNCLHLMCSLTGKADWEMGKSIQGFLTDKNRFVDRHEAAKIAIASGQIKQCEYKDNTLFSEDLY